MSSVTIVVYATGIGLESGGPQQITITKATDAHSLQKSVLGLNLSVEQVSFNQGLRFSKDDRKKRNS